MKIEVENGYIVYSTDDMDSDAIVIDELEVYTKRVGTGSSLVNKVIEENPGKKISLCAYPINGDIDLEDLINFYESCGFSLDWDDGDVALMSITA